MGKVPPPLIPCPKPGELVVMPAGVELARRVEAFELGEVVMARIAAARAHAPGPAEPGTWAMIEDTASAPPPWPPRWLVIAARHGGLFWTLAAAAAAVLAFL